MVDLKGLYILSNEYCLMSHFKTITKQLNILILNYLLRFLDFLLYDFKTFDLLSLNRDILL